MGQSEVIKILEKRKVWLTTGEISKILNVSRRVVIWSLNRLYHYNEVSRNIKREKQYRTDYRWKIKIKK